ncbi:chemosensory receptor a [Plakobranchus ocellatus]|uniref:Chemosensory receptor a n=1 Tax=Plakobranchus ocellatus TaxID=259542 RepID=A0AAV4D0B9_9GAST|nr:chemosensory receptor a [Plakobranchus ocellatus]
MRSSRWREGIRTQTGAPTVESVDLKVRRTKKEDRLIKMVVVIAIVFIISTTPGTIVMFISAVLKEYLQTSPYHTPTLVLQANMIALETVNNSINFFVYYMMGSRFKLVFRQLIGFTNSIVSS